MVVKYKIITLGCKVNQYDSNNLRRILPADFVYDGINPDLVVINSCAVTKKAILGSAQEIRRVKKINPSAKIALTGCWPKAYENEMGDCGADYIWKKGSADMAGFSEYIQTELGLLLSPEKRDNLPLICPGDRSRYFLKVQDGCNQFCSYCVVPYTRGAPVSRLLEEIIEEARQAGQAGFGEIILSGIHLGLYGRDLAGDKPINLAALTESIINSGYAGRIRLSSLEVNEISDRLLDLIAHSGKVCRHLHIPLQSGSDKILKLMNRPYQAGGFLKKIEQIRQAVPNIAITTDVIVGFPGETEADFEDSVRSVRESRFSKIHVFPFSAHEKTPASRLPGRVDEKIAANRARNLRAISADAEEKYLKSFKKKELEVVVIGKKNEKWKGKTEYYFDINFNNAGEEDELRPGKLVKVIFQ